MPCPFSNRLGKSLRVSVSFWKRTWNRLWLDQNGNSWSAEASGGWSRFCTGSNSSITLVPTCLNLALNCRPQGKAAWRRPRVSCRTLVIYSHSDSVTSGLSFSTSSRCHPCFSENESKRVIGCAQLLPEAVHEDPALQS